jgi:glycosyltransferase involved in cell wall biosynthesis
MKTVKSTQKPSILFLNWKDIKHPQAGGAEIVTHEIAKRFVRDGWKVTYITAKPAGFLETDEIDGISIIRMGGRLAHYALAAKYYITNLKNTHDFVVEEINTLPYMLGFAKGKEKYFHFYHQLAREIWFFEMVQPLSTIGFFIEPIYTWLQSKLGTKTLTVSQSTQKDLERFGYTSKNINIIREGIQHAPLENIAASKPKEKDFTVLFHSSLRDMKRPLEAVKAFGLLVRNTPTAKLWISGGGDQTKLKDYAREYGFLDSVTFFGRTTDEQKLDLMQRAHVLVSTSIKEGWGLIVSEANSMATPAISYDVDGLRDSTSFGGGVVVEASPEAMAKALESMLDMVKNDPKAYQTFRIAALESSKQLTFENCYNDFKAIIEA